MSAGFYPKLALSGIRKNKRLYTPYLLTCIGMVMMHYIIIFLANNEYVKTLRGHSTLQVMLRFGGWVIAAFSCLFLFYTNAFLIRRRKKEFGLYSILGMGKRNIGRILLWETLILSLAALAIGLFFGAALSKLAELGLVRIMAGIPNTRLTFSVIALRQTILVYLLIFALIFFNALRQIRFSSAISLLRSENVGEKPPKGNWFFGVLGVLLLAVAYYFAVSIREPLTAITLFFAAVLLVIAGTYLVMISGSVLFCRLLQKRKRYYYKPNHFVSVSSMVYRMKRNGAGLASICILATMVLVMLSSTTCLYFGAEDSLCSRFPEDFRIALDFQDEISAEVVDLVRSDVQRTVQEFTQDVTVTQDYCCASYWGILNGDTLTVDATRLSSYSKATEVNGYQLRVVPLADYNAMTGAEETLQDGEAIACVLQGDEYPHAALRFENGPAFRIVKRLSSCKSLQSEESPLWPTLILIVPSLSDVESLPSMEFVTRHWYYGFDVDLSESQQLALSDALGDVLFRQHTFVGQRFDSSYGCSLNSRAENRDDFYATFGGLFYLGILLSIVFLLAAVLILYYKQISEGYEDQSRFTIMQKVGMTKQEIRKSINSQLLTVFFLPLAGAGMHLLFAFPMIRRLLSLFYLYNVRLFALTTALSFLVFALFYTLVYRLTSNAYYQIVSGAKSQG